MKKKMKQRIALFLSVTLTVLICLAVRPVAAAEETKIADSCTEYKTEYYNGDSYKAYRESVRETDNTKTYSDYPEKEGYIFAGWYRDESLKNSMSETEANQADGAWAKFVPEEVLSVKAQISANILSTDKTTDKTYAHIRFITTVDNLKYAQVGFEFSINGNNAMTRASNKVYTQLRAVGENDGEILTYTPSGEFCALSSYFKTWTFTNVPEDDFDVQFSVSPFWITLDGTKVYGTVNIKTVRQGLAESELRPFEAEYDYEYYETLEDAVKAVKEDEKDNVTIRLLKDVTIEDTISVDADLALTITNLVKNGKAENHTITKATSFSGTSMFTVGKGDSLTIAGADAGSKDGIIIDGNQSDNGNTLLVNQGCLTIRNATVKNALVNDSKDKSANVYGGAVNSTGEMFEADNCLFTGNASDNNGGAVFVSGKQNTIKNTTFTQNRSRFNCGGAVTCSGGATTISGCVFDGNWVGEADGTNAGNKHGGAVYVNDGNAIVELQNSELKNNRANNGGAIRITAGSLKIMSSTMKDNVASNEGGAIHTTPGNNAVVKFNVEKTIFSENHATTAGAVLIGTTEEVAITECDFENNRANGNGGAIVASAGEINVTDCNFKENSAATYKTVTPIPEGFTSANGNGGAIYLNGSASAFITATKLGTYKFSGNTAHRDSSTYTWGAIAMNSTGEVRYSADYVFENNTNGTYASDTGIGCGVHQDGRTLTRMDEADSYEALVKAVKNAGIKETAEITLLGDVVIGDTRIDVNSGQKVVITNDKSKDVVISRTSTSADNMFNVNKNGSLKFVKNADGGSLTFDGKNVSKASMLFGRGELILDGITLQNSVSTNGGAIQLRNSTSILKVANCVFKNNSTTGEGGAILLNTEKSEKTEELQGYPSAEIGNTEFLGNKTSSNGGAICMKGGTVTLKDTGIFEDNTATTAGGAIYVAEGILNVSAVGVDSTTWIFKQNIATNSHGGAINVNGGTANIYHAKFESNRSEKNCGGAVRSGVNIFIQSCEFINNIAGSNIGNVYANGGAVYFNVSGKTYTIKESLFGCNQAKDGGAIRITAGTLEVCECDFKNNQALDRGDASAKGYGGAINMSDNVVCYLRGNSDSKNIFEANHTAQQGGAIFTGSKGTLEISNYQFINNSAEAQGNCYYGNVAESATVSNVEGWAN